MWVPFSGNIHEDGLDKWGEGHLVLSVYVETSGDIISTSWLKEWWVFVKEQNKFKIKYSHLTEEEIETVKKQETYREILDFNNISKI